MKHVTEFLKTTLTAGIMVLFPLLCCVYLLVRLVQALVNFISPLFSFVPVTRFTNNAVRDAAAIAFLLVICLLVGLFVKTSFGRAVGNWLESRIFKRIPGYRQFAPLSRTIFGVETAATPVIVQRGETRQIGFLIEENDANELTVFFPSSPSPLSGSVVIVKRDSVERLDVTASDVARMVTTFGVGTRGLLRYQPDSHIQGEPRSSGRLEDS